AAAMEAMALHDAGEAAALAGASDLDDIALCERIDADRGAYREISRIIDTEFLEYAECFARLRLVEEIDTVRVEADLHCRIAVLFRGLHLGHDDRTRCKDGASGNAPIVFEDLGHAAFLGE